MAKVLEDFSQEDDQDDDEIAVQRRRDYKLVSQLVFSMQPVLFFDVFNTWHLFLTNRMAKK